MEYYVYVSHGLNPQFSFTDNHYKFAAGWQGSYTYIAALLSVM